MAGKKTMQFRLKRNAGPHKQSGRVYQPGDIIESETNLAKLFREKFEVVEGKQPVFQTPLGGRSGNELPSDHAGREVYEDDRAADQQAKEGNANANLDPEAESEDEEMAVDQDDGADEDPDEETEESSTQGRHRKRSKKRGQRNS